MNDFVLTVLVLPLALGIAIVLACVLALHYLTSSRRHSREIKNDPQ